MKRLSGSIVIMSLQDRLATMLRDVFEVERVGADDFLLRRRTGAPVPLIASERDLTDYAKENASDGRSALGDVGDDGTGVIAALALLSVHIEESIEAGGDVPVTLLTVKGHSLSVQRAEIRDL
ncbi:hypothetical protein [Microbacterium aurum]